MSSNRRFGGNVNVERLDTEALQTLIDSHGAALELYARQWYHSPDDALQEALIELLRQNAGPDQPVAWLFKTIRHRAMNLARGERRRSEHHRQASQQRDEWFSEDNNLGFESEELQEAISRLPDLEREIVVARIWGELSFEQIAGVVDTSSSSAHRRYRSALQSLHEMLDGEDEKIGQKDEPKTQITY
ncbi:MAG: sigma-70 family RNA polymerase sigma factor [Planctomycetaceae bacterium]|nr:sigma-70 family RNA polymerase sigma factor [Planctomycetales bacterium]MCB9873121.1 sigma-70 family RNA polymerase sigma factor [Planctomycetaceae bacterium]MCB9937801.1 sigma-70 family RNA polymerase sigma factor [Planctomycetaceae bacterium]